MTRTHTRHRTVAAAIAAVALSLLGSAAVAGPAYADPVDDTLCAVVGPVLSALTPPAAQQAAAQPAAAQPAAAQPAAAQPAAAQPAAAQPAAAQPAGAQPLAAAATSAPAAPAVVGPAVVGPAVAGPAVVGPAAAAPAQAAPAPAAARAGGPATPSDADHADDSSPTDDSTPTTTTPAPVTGAGDQPAGDAPAGTPAPSSSAEPTGDDAAATSAPATPDVPTPTGSDPEPTSTPGDGAGSDQNGDTAGDGDSHDSDSHDSDSHDSDSHDGDSHDGDSKGDGSNGGSHNGDSQDDPHSDDSHGDGSQKGDAHDSGSDQGDSKGDSKGDDSGDSDDEGTRAAPAAGGDAGPVSPTAPAAGSDASATACHAAPGTRPYFQKADWLWNPIPPTAVLDEKSANMVSGLASGDHIADTGDFGVTLRGPDGITAATPRFPVTFSETGNWGPDPFAGKTMPIPPGTPIAPGSDGHLAVADPVSNEVYNVWMAKDAGSTWKAGWGAVTPLDGDGRETNGSSTGAGLARFAGVIRDSEIKAGVIPHALFFSSNMVTPDEVRYPATKTDGSNDDHQPFTVPEGARVQLDPALDLTTLNLTPAEKTVAKALQTYGAYVGDNGGARMAFLFEYAPGSSTYADNGLEGDYASLHGIPWDKLRVLANWDGGPAGSNNPAG